MKKSRLKIRRNIEKSQQNREKSEREDKPLFWKALSLAFLILIVNLSVIVYVSRNNFSAISGFAVFENVGKIYTQASSLSKIIFISQWVIIILILIFILIKDMKSSKVLKESINISSKKISGVSSTDLDRLYSVLQEKKSLRLSTISRAFNIKSDIALEWCKILESGNLAEIDYPGIGEPSIKIK